MSKKIIIDPVTRVEGHGKVTITLDDAGNVEKSRFVKEKSKIPISVSWDKGVDKFSGLIDMALDYGVLLRSGGWLQRVDIETGEVMDKKFREKETHNDEFWDTIFSDPKFDEHIRKKYRVG